MTKTLTILSKKIFFHIIFTFILPYEQIVIHNSKNFFYQFSNNFDKTSIASNVEVYTGYLELTDFIFKTLKLAI